MSDEPESDPESGAVTSDEVRELRRSLAAITDQLARVAAQVERLSVGSPSDEPPAASRAAPPSMTSSSRIPAPPAAGPWVLPPPAMSPATAGPPPLTSAPHRPPATTDRLPSVTDGESWADTAGLKVLGWVGGGVTVLGVVLLLVVAIQQDLLSPLARVLIGVAVGLMLVGGSLPLRRHEGRSALAVTVACTGLAVLYLATVGAVQLADLVGPIAGHGASIVIVVIAVAIAMRWREPWLAGVSFTASALLAPVVAGGFDTNFYLFEAIMVAGGAASVLLGLGLVAWGCAGAAATVAVLGGALSDGLRPVPLLIVVAMALGTWVVFVWRWVWDRAPHDPGPFPIRPRSTDPAQISRDYADYHAHMDAIAAARADATTSTVSLGVAAGLLAGALVTARTEGVNSVGIGVIAVVFALLFAVFSWASARVPALDRLSLRVVAWCASIVCAAVALLKLLDGDVRSLSWMVLATIVLVAVGIERLRALLLPAIAVAALSLLAAAPALDPIDLLGWPPRRLVDGSGLLPRGWAVVLPAGVCVLALCVATAWAVARCNEARIRAVAARQRSDAAAGTAYGYPALDLAATKTAASTIMGWTVVACSAVGCYGLLAVIMVLAYATSPTNGGYQAGQILVTLIVTVIALLLLIRGVRSVVLRIGGLGIAAVAVAKLLFFDTRNLEALPRAATVIVVGVLLLLAAAGYVMALGRAGAKREHSRAQ